MSPISAEPVNVESGQPYRVHVGSGVLEMLPSWVLEHFEEKRFVIMTDRNVEALHLRALGSLSEAAVLAVEPGEGSKCMASLERVLDFLCAAELGRDSLIIAFGGGVVGDLAGLAASLYMRGIAVLHCPTTLLAQVDSSIGGKTAVNLAAGKNLAGTFHQPAAVFADTNLLSTLSDLELRSGLGEVVKTALVGDAELFTMLEKHAAGILRREPALLSQVVSRCISVKGFVVSRDEQEAGERKKLNLGHTFAHAIEHTAGYGSIPHGEAVATGLQLACDVSLASGILNDDKLPARLHALLLQLGLSPSLASLRKRFDQALDPDALLAAMQLDKKSRAGQPMFVLPESIGNLAIDCGVSTEQLRRALS